ncbi:hypothetical protein AAMO2058_000724100 [Amorphochlora amoebiformis]
MAPNALAGIWLAAACSASVAANRAIYMEDCMSLVGNVCINRQGAGLGQIVGKSAAESTLIASFDFNDVLSQDGSPSAGAQIIPSPSLFGPGVLGDGSSLHVRSSDFFKIQINSTSISKADTWSLSLWLFLQTTPSLSNTPILVSSGVSSASLQLSGESRKLHLKLTDVNGGVTIRSMARIPLKRWTHIAVTQEGLLIQIYVNGKQDTKKILNNRRFIDASQWALGGGSEKMGGSNMYVDLLKIRNKAIDQDLVQAAAEASFPGLNPNGLSLGCHNCHYTEALHKCGQQVSTELCTKDQLIRNGYLTVARAMGWVDLSQNLVWGASNLDSEDSDVTATALCCKR